MNDKVIVINRRLITLKLKKWQIANIDWWEGRKKREKEEKWRMILSKVGAQPNFNFF